MLKVGDKVEVSFTGYIHEIKNNKDGARYFVSADREKDYITPWANLTEKEIVQCHSKK